MYPVSTAFKQAVRRSHKSVVKAEVWRGDTRVLELQPLDGKVDVDARRAVRRTCTLTLAAPEPTLRVDRQSGTYQQLANEYSTYALMSASVSAYNLLSAGAVEVITEVDAGVVPDSAFSALAPFGNEIRLWRGIEVQREIADNYADLGADYGTYSDLSTAYSTYGDLQQGITEETVQELVPLGVFVITKVDVATGQDGTLLTVNGSDRSLRISRARWTEPFQVSGNTATAVQTVLEDRWDDVEVDFTSTDRSVNKARFGLETDNDPWKDATKLATAAGMELFFDGDGIARMIPVRDYETATPDATYQENEDAMVLTLTRSLTNETTYNGVIASGEGSEASVTYRAEAWDEDIDSPTYRYGPFGEVPLFYSSPLLTSNDMALQAAQSILTKKKGTTEAVDWTQIVDPSLDVGDVVAVTNAETKVDRLMVLDRLSIPLGAASEMSAVARTIRSLGGTGFEEAADA